MSPKTTEWQAPAKPPSTLPRATSESKFDLKSVWTVEKVRADALKIFEKEDVREMIDYLGEQREQEVTSSLFMRGIQREIEKTGNTRFNSYDLESLVLKRLRAMVEEKEREDVELGTRTHKTRSLTIDSDEYSRDESRESDGDISIWGEHWMAKAFNAVERDENNFIGVDAFVDAVKKLELEWNDDEARDVFQELDTLELGCLSFKEFQKGLMQHVTKEFTHMVGPGGCDVLQTPKEGALLVRKLEAHHPLTIVEVHDGFGGLKNGGWVRQIDIIRRSNANYSQRTAFRRNSFTIKRQESRTMTPMAYRSRQVEDNVTRPNSASKE